MSFSPVSAQLSNINNQFNLPASPRIHFFLLAVGDPPRISRGVIYVLTCIEYFFKWWGLEKYLIQKRDGFVGIMQGKVIRTRQRVQRLTSPNMIMYSKQSPFLSSTVSQHQASVILCWEILTSNPNREQSRELETYAYIVIRTRSYGIILSLHFNLIFVFVGDPNIPSKQREHWYRDGNLCT